MSEKTDPHWHHLTNRAAREISCEVTEQAPPGFSTRVAAQAMAARNQAPPDTWNWALRWLVPASMVPAMAALVFFAALHLNPDSNPDSWTVLQTDPVILLDL